MKTQMVQRARPVKRLKVEAGVAAIELALLLPILVAFMMMMVFYGRCLWHYTVAQKAAQDAARYLSTVPRAEMMSPSFAQEAGALATEIARREIAELAPDSGITGPTAYCNTLVCGELNTGTVPTTVRVRISFTMSDPLGLIDFGWYGLRITADHTMLYTGN